MQAIRTITAAALVPTMRATGFRFSKEYRWAYPLRDGWQGWCGTYYRIVYKLVDTVAANIAAGLVHSPAVADASPAARGLDL